MSGYDPGGTGGRLPPRDMATGSAPDLSSLQENFSQQQAKITALRELVRQTESAQGKKIATAQEKVKNIAQRLTQYKTKATKGRLSRASSSDIVSTDLFGTRINEEESDATGTSFSESANVSTSIAYEEQQHMSLPLVPRARSETPGTEKINLLRQQMEQNRLKMAERESHKREMEERVIELKHTLESTQQTLERSVEFGRSTGDLTLLTPLKLGRFEFNKSTSDLTQLAGAGYGANSSFEVERLKYLESRVKVLEQELATKEKIPVKDDVVQDLQRKILDLEEALKEKECIIEARTQAVSLMTENLTAKGKNTVDLLEDTKQEMYRMQTNFVQAESNLKAEMDRQQVELDERNSKISNLEEMNNILETARYDLTVENASLKQKLDDVQDFSTKISELNKINQSLQHRITELESQKYEFITDAEAEQAKFGESDEKYRELLDRIQELEEEIAKKGAPEEDLLEKIRSMEATIEAQNEQIESYQKQQAELQENLQEKTVELNVLNANFSVLQEKLKNAGPKPLFPKSAEEEAEVETSKLKQQLDDANKSMIKSKLKIKQLQKQVDSFKKTSAVHEELVRLTEEVQILTQRLVEVEEEKGNLQLHLVNYDGSLPDSELEKRIKILEATCQNQTTAIQLLEEQKLDMGDDLTATKEELEAMRNQVKEAGEHQSGRSISCQMSSIEFEEKLEKCVLERDDLAAQLKKFEEEKNELQQKLDRYMVENMELLDRIEKLSLEKVSSAESIEIVEGLTAKEKQEIAGYEAARSKGEGIAEEADETDRSISKDADNHDEEEPREPVDSEEDLNSSLVKLREESSELMHKIELFTNERREVLEKLEALTLENQGHIEELEQLRYDHHNLLEKQAGFEAEESSLKERLARAESEKEQLVKELHEAKALGVKLEGESSGSSSQSSPAKGSGSSTIDRDSFEQVLRSVDNEVTNYNKNKDKNKKLQISKKLSSDAKNLQKMANTLLEEYYKNVDECALMKGEIDSLKRREEVIQKEDSASRSNEVETLKNQIMEMTHAHIEKVEQIEHLGEELERKKEEIAELKKELDVIREAEKSSDDEPELLKVELNSKNDEIRDLKTELEKFGAKKAAEVDELQSKLASSSKEIDILKELVAEQKQQLIDTYQEHENEIAAKLKEIQNYENEVLRMRDEIECLGKRAQENVAEYSASLKSQLDQLHSLIESQKQELSGKQETIESLNDQIIELYKTMEENSNRVIEKEDEVQYLQELLDSKKDEVTTLEQLLAENRRKIDQLENRLQEILSTPVAPVVDESHVKALEERNNVLEGKNKEQLEKLKKFAANLKKKNVQCQELEEKLAALQHELESLKQVLPSNEPSDELLEENAELSQKLHHLNNELHKLLQQKYSLESEKQQVQHDLLALQEKYQMLETVSHEKDAKRLEVENQLEEKLKELQLVQDDLSSKNVKIEKCKAIIKEKNKEIQRLQEHERKTAYLEDEIKMSQSKLEDFHNQTLLLGRLKSDKEEINVAFKTESEKNRKLEVDLELIEEENRKLKAKIEKLEKGILLVEERRNSLERQKKLLGEKLDEKSQEFSKHEDELMQRLANLSQHDEVIEHKLKDKEDELLELGTRLRDVEHLNDQLQSKLTQAESQLANNETALRRSAEIENDNYSLNQEVITLQAEIKRIHSESEARIATKDMEIDQLEIELTNQLTKIENERKLLQESLERSRDENTDLQDEIVRLQENVNSFEQIRTDLEKEVTWLKIQNESLIQDSAELQELRMQVVQDQTELENLRGQCETLAQNHQCEIQALKQQIADMEAIRTQLSQNQTDDQVIVQNEMRKLRELLEQKDAEISRLQMPVSDPFSGLPVSGGPNALEEKIRELENDATWKDARIQELQIEKDLADGSLEELRKQLIALQKSMERDEVMERELAQKSSELQAMSKQLFQTVPVQRSQVGSVPTFNTSQFFDAQPQSTAISLFDTTSDNWGWDEPVVKKQIESATVSAHPVDLQALRDEVTQLKAQIETYTKEIENLQTKLSSRDDEFLQIQDEIHVLRSQNSSLIYEVDDKTNKLKRLSEALQREQERAGQLEEQLQNRPETSEVTAPSVSSFFTDSLAPVFEEMVVPKKTYLCTPSNSEDIEGWSLEEPMHSAVQATTQLAAPTGNAPMVDKELETLKQLHQEQAQQLEDQLRQLQEMEQLNGVTQQKLREQSEEVKKAQEQSNLLQTQRDSLQQEVIQLSQLKEENLQLQQRINQLQKEYELQQQLQQQINQLEQEIVQLRTRETQQLNLLEVTRNQHAEETVNLRAEHQQVKDDFEQLQQANDLLQQDRDSFLQLQDELDIIKAQNASFQDELREKSDRIKRLAATLTETETRMIQLEEQLAAASASSQEQAVTTASFFSGQQTQHSDAVFEEIIQPTKAFQLLDEQDCWGEEEAILEEKHQQSSSVVLERRISEKDDYIRQLEIEKERLQQEITELKVKSGKLLKKVKEYRAKSNQLEQNRRSASMETNELDLAIQEELNSQIRIMEGKLKDLQAEKDKDAVEKESLLKRVDTLTAANERFTDMKERQDVQVEVQQAKIRELTVKLQQLEDWGEDSGPKERKETVVTEVVPSKVRELETEVKDLRVDNEELQALLDEEKANVDILEKRVQQKDVEIQELIERIDALSNDSQTIKSSLESLNQQKSLETIELNQKLHDLMNKNDELTYQIEKVRNESLFQSSEQEIKLQEQLQQLGAQLQYKEAEIVHLNERISQQALEDQTESLVQEILGKNQEISTLKTRVQQLQTERQELENNLTLQITKELASSRPEEKHNPRLAELERSNKELLDEKQQMEQELQVLNDQVLRSLEFEDRTKGIVLELDAKNIEIEALKTSLEMMKRSEVSGSSSDQSTPKGAMSDEEHLRKQLQKLSKERSDLEANYRITLEQRDAHWAQVVEERGAQVAESWKQHVDLREAEFSVIEKSLREEIERLQGGQPQREVPSEEEREVAAVEPVEPSMIQKMKEALENQEIEIVTLKEQLAIRSAEYARLAAQVDPFAVKHASNMVTSEPRPITDGDKVSRSELELALYMIYQRDMRCEELELELRNLLEERDALQLRLSNALRQQEDFKRKFTTPGAEVSGDSSDISKTTTPEKSLQQIVQESGIGAASVVSTAGSSDPISDVLSNKLSELHSIGHVKDKRLQEDREERYRQLALIQRDLANMPLEAAAKITGTNVVQSEASSQPQQQQQSASSVLINWILGKKSDS